MRWGAKKKSAWKGLRAKGASNLFGRLWMRVAPCWYIIGWWKNNNNQNFFCYLTPQGGGQKNPDFKSGEREKKKKKRRWQDEKKKKVWGKSANSILPHMIMTDERNEEREKKRSKKSITKKKHRPNVFLWLSFWRISGHLKTKKKKMHKKRLNLNICLALNSVLNSSFFFFSFFTCF